MKSAGGTVGSKSQQNETVRVYVNIRLGIYGALLAS
jgi:hypothetical protein